MSLQVKKPRIAFTADAYVKAIALYGERLFDLIPIYGKIIVIEEALIFNDQLENASLLDPVPAAIIAHWFDITDPTATLLCLNVDPSVELDRLAELNKIYPDNVLIIMDNLRDYAVLNRTYAQDELLTLSQLQGLICG